MQNLQQDLIELLKNEDNLVVDNQLNKNKIIEAALKVEPFLISLLIKNDTFKKHFFQEVENVLVFDKIKFQRFVNNKSFLPDSYTAFKNKIGLAINDDSTDNFIKAKNDVVLVWPHKDCVLEGGQNKEDQKRNEIFWNETLAPDNVDRLLDAKAFTNFKKYDKDGVHNVTDIKGDENLILKGNNLLVISSLLKTHRGKIKLIYIDPPYNTGNDDFKYNDSFNHSAWLTFIKNRLVIAKDLLKEDGVIFVQCDDSEQAYLKVVMDEIFNRENFISCIVYRRRKSQANLSKNISPIHDYILCYSKSNQSFLNKIKPNIDESKYKNPDNDPRGSYVTMPCTNGGGSKYTIKTPTGRLIEDEWRFKKDTYDNLEKDNRLVFPRGGEGKPRYKLFLSEKKENGVVPNSWWDDLGSNQEATRELKSLFNKNIFSYPKPEKLIKRVIELATNENDIVLDFFLGSGTTASVAHKMNRKYIGVEQMDYINTVTTERLNKVIEGEQGGISKDVQWKGGGSFVYAELMQYNQYFINNIQEAKTKEDVLMVWEEMQNKAFLSYQFDKDMFNSRLEAFKTASLETMQYYLVQILDKNQLYLNYSEIEDATFKVPDTIVGLNKGFYDRS
ncbi:restriction endonuclease subunit M [Wenyingzhuangia fucanilytica]|uniref:site-specific DNA-methyltransferase (adenine-specific) n=1 Tax=Wenyingzhuangia fucanilytica TaxID=1790137 RepID=A0A1B1Y685_9FLAO|nr:site-specific DNA-methyltransferase [Wenyingzhuangia fucanilytica]ANW96259.1 restriction endonuclease subunit M [Wenyingzhuangia fucanilytica]